jgi:50S ribosomal protein L16 3-hydroxylase
MFGSLTPRAFLRRYWQKEPLLLRGALSARFGLSGDVLAGLACEEDVESRLVFGSVERGFRLEHGPFAEKRFRRLPEREWTLLVQDVDKHLPRVARLFDEVSFVPDWRVDDVMVSYAVPGGSVGPHVDAYDVFLVQLAGERRWQLSTHGDLTLRSDSELKLLEHFAPEVEHRVGPGDVLYLPPGVAHHGVAESECLTASVGFRAPSQDELLAELLQEVAAEASPDSRYTDPDLRPSSDPSELRGSELARLRELIRSGMAVPDARIDAFIGRYLTRLKPHLEQAGSSASPGARARRLLRAKTASLVKRPGSRWLHFATPEGPRWFVNGEPLQAPKSAGAALRRLAQGDVLSLAELRAGANLEPLLVALLQADAIEPARSRTPARRSRATRQTG